MWLYPDFLVPLENSADETLYIHELFPNSSAMFDEIIYPQYNNGTGDGVDGQEPKDPFNAELEERIYRHYETRQIAHETPAAFLKALSCKMNEIMPYYYKLAASENLVTPENAFDSVDFVETYTETGENLTESVATGESGYIFNSQESGETITKNSLTPGESVDDIENYMDSAGKQNNSASGQQDSTKTDESLVTTSGTNTRGYTKTQKGSLGARPYAEEVKAYRSALLRITESIIRELSPLFLALYS